MKPKIRSSIGIVKLDSNRVEFFKGNIRESLILKLDAKVLEILVNLNGEKTIEEIGQQYNLSSDVVKKLTQLVLFLKGKSIILDEEERTYDDERVRYSRVFSLLEDYTNSGQQLLKAWGNIQNSRVLIIGLGAVGSWIAANLIQSGVSNLHLLDNDVVEDTNLHRQWGYSEGDIGTLKTEALKQRLLKINEQVTISTHNTVLEANTLEKLNQQYDLIINCADFPTVDQTALWVGEFAMKHRIPHIIGGGYNLHVTLIGQTVLPYQSACVKCFEKQLIESNEIDTVNLKKLAREGRKIGSFGPMCAISASIAATEAIRVLSQIIPPVNINRRGEFNIYSMNMTYKEFKRLPDCEWCGNE